MDNPPDLIHLSSVNFDGFWRWIIRQTDNLTLVWMRPLQTNDVGERQISVRSVWQKSEKYSHGNVYPPPPRITNKFHGFQYKKSRHRSIFVVDQLKGMQSSKQGEWKGYTKGVPIFAKKKNGILKVKRLDLETEPPRVNICWVPPLPLGPDLTFNAEKVCAAPNLVVPRIFKSYFVFLCLGVQQTTH